MKTILLATKNSGKVREIAALLAPLNIAVASPAAYPAWREVNEVGETFAANAILKAENGAAQTGMPTLADDSGLVVEALNGAPGVHSARYAALGGGNADDADNNRLLLKNLTGVANRRAKYVCVLAFSSPEEMPRCFYGETVGEILTAPRGANGFGYDPLFFSADLQCAFGEAAAVAKNQISHRGRALQKFLAFIREKSTAATSGEK
ncbi:non-canonical purine NTP pyrophosphatase [Planctomycetales bacterium]|nr:non-canonical purine NTP pyrophosphatase [Planctomycetales bacterium]GHS99516.1 non-canonical purine NTP pyrophosphatase [Planctomycetales bacterium]GHT07995.1 non-canonical purine NTP pyrophosphatase [Planctomycetales bacterium]